MKKVVIIGGGVAAKAFAIASLQINKDYEYTMIRNNERSPIPCGIPYSIGTLKDSTDNLSPDKEMIDEGLKLLIDDVNVINRANKTVETKNNGSFPYDKLVIATGSNPVVPPFPGKELSGIYTIEKDLDKIVSLKKEVESANSIVIVGGGFIGVELADEISKFKDKKITLVELAPHCLSVAFEPNYSTEIENILRNKGVDIRTGISVQGFKGDKKVSSVEVSTGESLDADLVFLVIGASPNSAIAQACGLECDERKAVKVDAQQRTSDPDIMAIGDCASKVDLYTNGTSNIRLASIAAKEGRNAAYHLNNGKEILNPVGITNLFSTAVSGKYFGATGMTKQQAQNSGYSVIEIGVNEFNRHPGKLPGAAKYESKFFFSKDDLLLLGAQISGNEQVAEMVNVIGIAIQNKAYAKDLYAYNYGSHPMGTTSPNKYIIHQAALKALAANN
ncbi:MAG: FAD-dependent oxidoreductase [Sedimentibacter sp.]|uniref:FAD-dependent oxidoreductase n=1 Tax=Sedimentibacter sp. TaxID=1960295 RepID=UPI0029819034|nr:FAD-dependent oxidoreductase [Sedimentibacter sp.]MDW5300613.1 FAD-dependent oxidoreductase [Sedimentibacter sp.]